MKAIALSLLLVFAMLASDAYAGSYQGQITHVFAYVGKVYIDVQDGGFDNPTTCTGSSDHLALWVDPSTDFGKALVSISLTAKSTGRVVWVSGNNTCITGPLGASEQMLAIDFKG